MRLPVASNSFKTVSATPPGSPVRLMMYSFPAGTWISTQSSSRLLLSAPLNVLFIEANEPSAFDTMQYRVSGLAGASRYSCRVNNITFLRFKRHPYAGISRSCAVFQNRKSVASRLLMSKPSSRIVPPPDAVRSMVTPSASDDTLSWSKPDSSKELRSIRS